MKKTLIVILGAIILGGTIAFCLFNKVVLKEEINTVIVNAFQIGAFTNLDNATKVADRNNGIVVSDEGIYRVYVAVLNDTEAIKKLRSYYEEIGLKYYLKEIKVNKEYLNCISTSEELLKKSSSDTYALLNKEMLNKYKELQKG